MVYDVTIIGGGVIGCLIARELMRYELSVCIVEKNNDVCTGSSKANSGIVHAGYDAESGSLKAKLNVKGCLMMQKIADELGVKYKKIGSIVAGTDISDKITIQKLFDRGRINGVNKLELLGRSQILELEPHINENIKYGLYAPDAGIICPYELTIAAAGNAMDNGAQLIRNFDVDKIVFDGKMYSVYSDKAFILTRFIVNAAGIYSDKIARLVDDDSFTVIPKAGQYMLIDKAYSTAVSHTVFRAPTKHGKGILITPTVDGNLLIGPTSEVVLKKTNKNTTSSGLHHIITSTSGTVSDIPYSKVITSFCGLRASVDSNDFIIRRASVHFINCAGIDSPGLSASPAIAEYVIQLLLSEGLKLKKNDKFNPYRRPSHEFRDADINKKNEIIKNNPLYGQIVCRCEGITEGEIIDAIKTNPGARDFDGIKFRTRCGMGRCQAGFCCPRVCEIISRELGIKFTQVSKFGGDSYFNMCKTKGNISYEKK